MEQLLEQKAPPELFPWEVISVCAAVAILLVLFTCALLLIRNGHRRREWEHAERIKALEMGQPLPARDAPWTRAWICIAIGAGVPLIAFVLTGIAHERPGTADAIFIAPAIVSVLSVISATVLGGFLFHKPLSAKMLASDHDGSNAGPGFVGKPMADPDAIDVVGRRG